ncbi:KN motif and ankyrin repeat domain-containing protein 1 isoform X2 [Drosophila mojavensis]|uniref:KN motif and ankyrin repeat domain-containing protein 1 isoform X2 n=1 Tax=Drosophila mojavensis TaxID=7230 RepID=UPI0013EEDFA5|nr:KN motif and ankyrin repeat domain-containing protein 1 isoform X2 [Drosophila mojavensis]
MLWNFLWFAVLWLFYEARKPRQRLCDATRQLPGSDSGTPNSTLTRSVRSCNCCPYGYHIDLDFVRYCEALANAKPSEEELQRRDRRRSRKSMEFMLGFESLFGSDWQPEGRVQPKLIEAAHESEPDSPRPAAGQSAGYRPRSASVPRFSYGSSSLAPRPESPYGTASSTCSSLRGGIESDAGIYPSPRSQSNHSYGHARPAVSPPERRAFLHEALDEVCSDFERTLERASTKRRKAGAYSYANGGSHSTPMDRNNNSLSLSLSLNNGYGSKEAKERRMGHSTWDRYFDVAADSCMAGNRSPRSSTPHLFQRSNTLPLQQRPSPGEVQYESYVLATVAANAKSPVEQLEQVKAAPPPPPPRRHHLTATPKSTKETNGHDSASPLQSPASSEAGQTTADAQALCQIREQMALSLKRLKDLEEQVKVIPDMELELNSLRSEKQRLQRRNEELLRSQRQTPSPPSPGVKNGSPVQFTPQRISPVSLESLGARMRSSSSSPSIIRRDVATQAAGKVTATRDAAVGAKLSVRDVATQQAEAIYSQAELKQRIEQAIGERRQQRLRQLISVGTQMYVPQREQREKGMQTVPERPVLKHNVSISAKPATRESFTSCQPEVRSVGSSEHRITDVLCEKCAITKRSVSVSCGTEEPLERPKPAQLLPGRSNTFSLGEHEQLAIKRKAIGCQTLSTSVHSASSQTTTATVRSTGAQVMPEQQQMATQCAPVEATSRQTDTNGLQRLTRSSVKAEQLMAPLVRPTTCHTGSNTEPSPLVKPERLTVHSACNTEQVRKRDVGCGDIVKPHISIACAANYCDSCKEAIQVLAKDFSKAETSDLAPVSPTAAAATPTAASSTTSTVRRSSSADSRIPRPKHLTSPSPVRKQFQRQNTYTLPTAAGAAATPKSPKAEGKTLLSSLQEKPPSAALDASPESQSFIKQPSSKSTSTSKDLDFTQMGDDELIVREEKRVSISWSRDASPAPLMTSSATTTTSTKSASPEQASSDSNVEREISQGARKKSSTPLKSSQSEGSQVTVIERKTEDAEPNSTKEERPPTKAQLHQLAQAPTEPRQKSELAKELKEALKVINDSLLKKLGSRPITSFSLKASKATISDHWFRISSTATSNPHEVEDYLDYFESLSVPLLEYCVNLSDSNGNTAMHYAVSHGNFDVVSILLDSKVCNVNQMNNAGYTCVMLVSLAKLKQAAHRTVVERLFQMADVNIRAKKHCQTALMLAVSHGNSDMVEMLLEAGADINIQDEDGSTALMCAAEHGRVDIVKHLLSQPECDSLVQDVDGSTAFKIAWQAGHRDVGLLLYVHEQMLRSKLPNRGEPVRKSLPLPARPKQPK